MSGWSLAPSLVVLRNELNERWPDRDKASDGTIGDERHQATKSDHNPNARGRVDALDVDKDGIDVWYVFDKIKKHPSARYFIFEKRLYHRLRGWKPEPYTGVNPHEGHFHLSIDQTVAAENNTRPWGLLEGDMFEQKDRDVAWATTHRTWALIKGEDVVYKIGGVERREPNKLAQDLAEIKERLAALSEPAIDYDRLAQALLRAVLSK